jgi:hypothetical protein
MRYLQGRSSTVQACEEAPSHDSVVRPTGEDEGKGVFVKRDFSPGERFRLADTKT